MFHSFSFGVFLQTREAIAIQRQFMDAIERQIEKHRATFDPENPRDFIDLYLEMQQDVNQAGIITGKDEITFSISYDINEKGKFVHRFDFLHV